MLVRTLCDFVAIEKEATFAASFNEKRIKRRLDRPVSYCLFNVVHVTEHRTQPINALRGGLYMHARRLAAYNLNTLDIF